MIEVPRSIETPEQMDQIAPILAHREYGPGTFISSRRSDGDLHQLGVGLKIPVEIIDAKDHFYNIRTIPDIVKITFERADNDRYIYRMVDFDEFSKSVERSDHLLIHKLERELITETYQSIARIPTVANNMTPLMEISNLFRFNEKLSISEIKEIRGKRSQMDHYIEFMIGNGFIREEKGYLYPEKKLLGYLDGKGEVHIPLLGEMLRGGYVDLVKFLHLTGLKPYLTLAFSYYMPSSQAKNMLRMKIDNLVHYYKKIYHTPLNRYKVQNHVSMLNEVEVLSIKNRLIEGNERIFRNQLKVLESFS